MCKKKKNAATNIKRAFSSDVNCSLGFQFAEKSTVNLVAVQRQGIFFSSDGETSTFWLNKKIIFALAKNK